MSKRGKEEKAAIDMIKYNDCAETMELCKGCGNEFLHQKTVKTESGEERTEESRKCKVFSMPATKWPRKNVNYAMQNVTVREYDRAGKAVPLKEMDLPLIDHRCSMATHITRHEIVSDADKKRAGQQKQKKN